MPLNASPPTVDGPSFDLKVAAASGAAFVDFALWGGLVPGDVDRLDELAERGVVGFKAFMCPTGVDDFAMADDETLHAGMARAARLGLPVAVHAESAELTTRLAAEAVRAGTDVAARLPRLASRRGRARGDRARDRDRGGDGMLAARRPRLDRSRRPARRGGARPRRRRHLRDVPALPRARRGGRRSGSAWSRSARRRCARATTSTTLWRAVLAGHVDLVASDHSPEPARAEAGRRRVRRLGRDRRLPDAAAGAADRGPAARALARGDRGAAAAAPARRFRLAGQGIARARRRRGSRARRPGRTRRS